MLLVEVIDGADEDVLTLALADGADVDDHGRVGGDVEFAAQGGAVGVGDVFLDTLDIDPTVDEAVVVLAIEIGENFASRLGDEDDPGGVGEGILDERNDLGRGELVLGEKAPRSVALMNVE